MKYTYKPQGTCSVQMDIDINEENDTINSVKIVRGCPGNTLGVSKLVEGRKVDEIISYILSRSTCKGTKKIQRKQIVIN